MALYALILPFAGAALDKVVTMYHVNPRRFGPVPRNMDTADVAGDLFFELFEVLVLPLQCNDPDIPPWRKPFQCRNLETNDPTDVVNKITLKVDSHYSGYAMCNIGNKQVPPKVTPCNATVGATNLYSHFGQFFEKQPCYKDYDCWTKHAAAKLTGDIPGYWYSPLKYGDCSQHSGANCTWAVKSVDKIVNASCHSDSFFGAVQKASPASFAHCTGGVNASDPCWVRGFYTAVLGPDAAKPKGWKVAGVPLADIIAFWTRPFESDDPREGGCPGLPIPPHAELQADAPGRGAWAAEEMAARGPTFRQRRWQDLTRRLWLGGGEGVGEHEEEEAEEGEAAVVVEEALEEARE